MNVFQKPSPTSGEEPLLANSTVVSYLGLDRREGLVSIAKQLLQSEYFIFHPFHRVVELSAQKPSLVH